MKKILNALLIASVSMAVSFTSVAPASALPLPAATSETKSDVVLAQVWLKDRNERLQRQGVLGPGRVGNGSGYEGRRYFGGRNEYRRDRDYGRRGWYNGHRGYSDRRNGYRRHNDGFWYPLAAFGAGALIGGAIGSNNRATPNSHAAWCADRYRTYRAYDNTYVPRAGVRAQCQSPYN